MSRFTFFILVAASTILTLPVAMGTANDAAGPLKLDSSGTYTPGLGDFMTAYVQPHHIKLWFAGSKGNWRLAAYQAQELRETFEDVSSYQASWKKIPVADLIEQIIKPALKRVDIAIENKDAGGFRRAYSALTAACNACHRASSHDFLKITTPAVNPFSDQTLNKP